jgi:hypothetical protein
MHMLTPGMVGIVRPKDSVRHIVPKEADVKLLVIWPAGEPTLFRRKRHADKAGVAKVPS